MVLDITSVLRKEMARKFAEPLVLRIGRKDAEQLRYAIVNGHTRPAEANLSSKPDHLGLICNLDGVWIIEDMSLEVGQMVWE